MSRPRDTWHYTPEQREQLNFVRAALLTAYRKRQLSLFSRQTGLSISTVYRILSGHVMPQHRVLAKFHEALK